MKCRDIVSDWGKFFKGRNGDGLTTDSLADAVAIAQHHDAATGTEDNFQQESAGERKTKITKGISINNLAKSPSLDFSNELDATKDHECKIKEDELYMEHLARNNGKKNSNELIALSPMVEKESNILLGFLAPIFVLCAVNMFIFFKHDAWFVKEYTAGSAQRVDMGEMSEGRKWLDCLGNRFSPRYYTGYPKDLGPSRIIHFTSERQFVQLLHKGRPVVVAFSTKCNYMKHLEKILEEAAAEFYPHIRFMRCPKQSTSTDCVYYVMRYMYEIIRKSPSRHQLTKAYFGRAVLFE